VQGNLYQTRNIDLDEDGVIKLASPTVSIYDIDNDADYDSVTGIFHGSQTYIIGADLFRESNLDLTGSFTNVTATDTTPPSPGAENDGVYFNGTEVVTDGSTIKYNNSGTWTTISGTPSGSAGNPSVVEVFPNQTSLLVGRGNQVARVNSSWTVAVTLTLPADYVVLSIATNGNYAYIATRHKGNGEAMMFIWTGINTTNDGSYGVGTYGIQSIRKYQSSVALMDSMGRLLQFNGSGFTELASLPVYYTRTAWGDANNDYANMQTRGMVVDGDLIYINIATETQDSLFRFLPNQLGNIWCYDPKVGLYQRYSYTNTEVLSATTATSNVNTSTDIITISGIVVPATGSLVYWDSSSTTIGNLLSDKYYYVIKVTDTTFKLAETYQDAIEGTAIDLGALSGAVSLDFRFISQRDFGQGVENTTGGVLVLNDDEYSANQLGRIAITGEPKDNTLIGKYRFMQTINPLRNLGYFVTPKMFAENPQDQYADIVLRFKPLDYGDKITIKYRVQDKLRMPVMPNSSASADSFVTWTDSTTFTTVSAPQDNFYDMSTVSAGDELEIIAGGGSGFIASVASISRSGFQYTVTIDTPNPFYVAGDKSFVKIDNWKYLETIDGTTFSGSQKNTAVDTPSGWIQLKIIMEGVGITLYDTIVTSKAFEKAR
jgi:hypothetical protein